MKISFYSLKYYLGVLGVEMGRSLPYLPSLPFAVTGALEFLFLSLLTERLTDSAALMDKSSVFALQNPCSAFVVVVVYLRKCDQSF